MNWKNKYKVISENLGGGQGNCFIVEEIESKKTYFLKVLKNNATENRQRFFRETTLFKSLNVLGIPKIIETNADRFKTDEELFYCAEFVKGQSIDKLPKPIEFIKVVDIFKQLLNVLVEIHNEEIVHRDIKPENIIIDENGKLFLVDFGISVRIIDDQSITTNGQELGNRFIRLPEFAPGSTSKRDIRSDLTLSCGIALFLLTGKSPRVLVNEYAQYPHQTDDAIKIISKVKFPFIWNTIFDRAFQIEMSKRWSSAKEIIDLLNKMDEIDNTDEVQIEERLKLHAEGVQNRDLNNLKINLIEVNTFIKNEILHILKSKAEGFRTEEMGWVYNLGDVENKNQIRAYPIGKKECVVINIRTVLLGEQIVGYVEINNDEIEICRICMGDDSIEKTTINERIMSKLLSELVKLL